MVQMKPFHYLYVIIGMLVAAFFGISLDMGITCMIPVSFVVIGYSLCISLQPPAA